MGKDKKMESKFSGENLGRELMTKWAIILSIIL